MRQVGSRRERSLSLQSGGPQLAEGARFNEAISRLAPSTIVPKGVYRYKSHEQPNQHQQDCLVCCMALLAVGRG